MAGRGVKLAEEVKADLVHPMVLMDVQVNDEMKLFSPKQTVPSRSSRYTIHFSCYKKLIMKFKYAMPK